MKSPERSQSSVRFSFERNSVAQMDDAPCNRIGSQARQDDADEVKWIGCGERQIFTTLIRAAHHATSGAARTQIATVIA